MSIKFLSSIDVKNVYATLISGTTVCAANLCTSSLVQSSIVCGTTCLKAPAITLTTGAASGCVLTSDGSGNATWQTPSGGGGALCELSDVNVSSPAAGDVLTYTGASGWANCTPIDISANLGTGDLLYYDGATISGSTFTQNSATVTTFRGDCLMICSNAASKIIRMCDNTTVGGSRNLYLCSAYGCCGYGGGVYIYAGYGDRPSGGVSSTYTCGGDIYMCGGNGCNCITTAGTVSCGGNVCIYGGWACNCYSAGAARGGDIILCGGYAYGTTSANCGGNITISTGYGGTCYGALYMTAGSVTMCLSASLNCLYMSRRLDVYGCSSNIGLRVCYGCGYALCWVGSSDCRLKKDIEPYTGALSTITQLQAVRYHDCDDIECPKNQVGLIAQDVEPILPEIVSCIEVTEEEKEKYGICDIRYGLSYDKLTAVLVEAIKEQQVQINELKAEIAILKGC